MKVDLISTFFYIPWRLPRATASLRITALSAFRCIATSSSNQLAQVRTERNGAPELWFCSSSPLHSTSTTGVAARGLGADERTLKLGKTLRLLQTRLPILLTSPLPPEILSPQIKLHLFPSTHPHLPTVSGRVAYHAALWSAPVAWGRVPIVGNVKLVIISERVVRCGPSGHSECSSFSTSPPKKQNERLIVRWKTSSSRSESDSPSSARSTKALYRGIGPREQVNRFTEWLSNPTSLGKQAEEFCGMFIFEFDEEGRIVAHTIEHAEESGSAEKASRVVNLTDWLIGRARARREKTPELVWLVDGQKRQEENRR
ncbi:MAG: hypothetical protein L6R38_000461 [Xanthoria sp. 2 TBL-2021]|nr:MAG: hypothetical protein L6R38_000461 [Xanthoria sp. 2 TBL-2021]